MRATLASRCTSVVEIVKKHKAQTGEVTPDAPSKTVAKTFKFHADQREAAEEGIHEEGEWLPSAGR